MMGAQGRVRTFLVCVTAGLLLSLTVVAAPPASAWNFGCGRFVGGDPALNYRFFDITQTYRDAFNQAQYAWDLTSAPGTFYENATDSDPHIEVRDAGYSWSDWARTNYTCIIGGYWLANEVYIEFNTSTMLSLTARQKKMVSIHELGHAYGLDHEFYGCSSPGPTIMIQGTSKFSCSGDGPWYDDYTGVQILY